MTARAKLKSIGAILRSAHEWKLNGTYYHIWVYPNLKIGFRSPYRGYLGKDVQVIKAVDRRNNVVPQMYKVLNRLGNPIFLAHRSWFEFIEYDEPLAVGETAAEIPSIHDQIADTQRVIRNDQSVVTHIQTNVIETAPLRESPVKDFDYGTYGTYWNADEPEWQDIDKKVTEIKTEVNQLSELSWDQLFEV